MPSTKDDFLAWVFARHNEGPATTDVQRPSRLFYGHRKAKGWAKGRHTMLGVTTAEAEAILDAQGGVCAICKRPNSEINPFVLDHDHKLGWERVAVRGLLCARCNVALGSFADDPTLLLAAIEYLASWPAKTVLEVESPR